MTALLSNLAFHVYALGAAFFLGYLVRPANWLAWGGRVSTGLGLLLHGAALAMLFSGQGGMPLGIAQGFSTVAFLLLAISVFVDWRYRAPVIGAFLNPVALAVLWPGLLLAGGADALPAAVRRPLLPVHIGIALVGMAAFAVATAAALLYLLMERQVKSKRFGLLFSRLPSLQFLDELNRKLVLAGFVALSLTLITGVFFTTRGVLWTWGPVEVATIVAWAVFAGLLNARRFAGWQGKRVAVLTMAGFCILLVSFFSSYDPSRLGGLR